MKYLFSLLMILCSASVAQVVPLCDKAIEQGILSTQEGWLFNDVDLKETFVLEEHPEILPYLAALGEAFADNGITVVTALLPTRPMVYNQGLDQTNYNVKTAWETYQAFRSTLNENGFLTPDLLFRFRTAAHEGKKVFFKLDHHWTPEGAQLTAEEVANALELLSVYQDLEKSLYTTTGGNEETYRGSRISDVETYCGKIDIADEPFTRFQTQGENINANLFGEGARPSVVYVGTSNGEDTMNFPGSLRESLGLNVLKSNMIGGGAFTALQNFVYSNDYQLDGYRPPLIIWELNINTTTLVSNEALDFSHPLSYRQLIPSLYGQCDKKSLLEGETQGKLVLDTSNQAITGSNNYLSITANNPALAHVNVQITYDDGKTETVDLLRPTRLASPNRYFLEFSDSYSGKIKTIELSALDDSSVVLKAQVCNTGRTTPRRYDVALADLQAPKDTSSTFVTTDFAKIAALDGTTLTGFSNVEGNDGRWALGPETAVSFTLTQPAMLSAKLAFINPIANQTIEVIFNNKIVDTLANLSSQEYIEKNYTLDATSGTNHLSLRYADWNGNKTTLSQADPRPMAIFLRQLQLGDGEPQTIPNPGVSSVNPLPVSEPLPVLDLSEGNLVTTETPDTLQLNGISSLENGDYRWGLGPETKLDFRSDKAQALEVEIAFFNPLEGQSLVITFNGAIVQELTRLHQGTEMNLKFYVNAIPGDNHLSVIYSDWNGNKTTFAPNDTRPMAVLFKLLEIRNRL